MLEEENTFTLEVNLIKSITREFNDFTLLNVDHSYLIFIYLFNMLFRVNVQLQQIYTDIYTYFIIFLKLI